MKFVAIDGEGMTDQNGIHHYVLLTIGSVSLMINDGRNRKCKACTSEIEGNMITVPVGSTNVTNYFHPTCYYRTARKPMR